MVLCSALLLCAVASTRADDFPKPIEPPKTSTLTPIVPARIPAPAAPSGTTPIPIIPPDSIGKAGQTSFTPKLIDAAHRHIPPLIDQMLDGKLTPERAWDEKLLSIDDLLWIFTSYIDPWGSFRYKFNEDMRRDLLGLIVKNGSDKLQEPEKLSTNVRLWLADYYMSTRDEKCVTMCESILKGIKAPVTGEDALVFQTIERLARYHAETGSPKNGAQVWMRMADYYPPGSRYIPDSEVEAGRNYAGQGNRKKAIELCELATHGAKDHVLGAAYWDWALYLMADGQHKQAQELLKRAISIVDAGELIRVGLRSLLGQSLYTTGNWDESRQVYQQVLEEYPTMATPRSWELALAQLPLWANEKIGRMNDWAKSPLLCQPTSVKLKVEGGKSASETVMVRTFHRAPLVVSCDDPRVQVRLQDDGRPADIPEVNDVDVDRKINITITAPQGGNFETQIVVSSPQLPATLNIPLTVQVNKPKALTLSANALFFGTAKMGEPVTKSLTVRGTQNFRILKVTTDDENVQVATPLPSEGGKEHTIVVQFTPKTPGQFCEGQIRIATDNAEQEVVTAKYAGWSQN